MKNKEQPHGHRLGWLKSGNPPCDLTKLPRCTAKAKSTGNLCRQPAMKNGKCYWHGGKGSGAPKGNLNALKDGHYTAEAIAEKKFIRKLMNESRKIIKKV